MILRLVATWALMTLAAFVIMYILDREEKLWTSLWSRRMAYCGSLAAVAVSLIIILERI
jgi:hypothetical protein